MRTIKQMSVAAGLTLLVTFAAEAADLRRPVARAAAYVPTWTGFYAGINAGGSIGVNSIDQSAAFGSPVLGANGLLSSTGRSASTGWLSGGQIGYNWQLSSWLIGIEADWQWASQKDSGANCTPAASLAFFGPGANGFGYCLLGEQKVRDIGTARARAGMLVHDSLWYVTGGLAWGTVKDSYAFGGSANPIIFPGVLQPGPFLPSSANFSSRRTGWTIGAGAETKIAGGWSAKLEYLFVELGTINEALGIAINPVFGPAFTTNGVAIATSSTHVRDNIVRLGLNYKFDLAAGVVSK
jgi:outer membrane immunogenic protein